MRWAELRIGRRTLDPSGYTTRDAKDSNMELEAIDKRNPTARADAKRIENLDRQKKLAQVRQKQNRIRDQQRKLAKLKKDALGSSA